MVYLDWRPDYSSSLIKVILRFVGGKISALTGNLTLCRSILEFPPTKRKILALAF